MPKRIKLRALTTEEETEIRRLAASRKEPMRLVQRAQVIAALLDDSRLPVSRAGEAHMRRPRNKGGRNGSQRRRDDRQAKKENMKR